MIKTLQILTSHLIIKPKFQTSIPNIKYLHAFNSFSFTKSKKVKPAEVVYSASIKMSKLNPELNGFIIY